MPAVRGGRGVVQSFYNVIQELFPLSLSRPILKRLEFKILKKFPRFMYVPNYFLKSLNWMRDKKNLKGAIFALKKWSTR